MPLGNRSTPDASILEVLALTVNDTCLSQEVVSLTCTHDLCGTRARQFQQPELTNNPAKIIQGSTFFLHFKGEGLI